MIKIIIIRIVIIIITLSAGFFILAYGAREASAQSTFCKNLQDVRVGVWDPNSQVPNSIYNGNFCDTPGNFNTNKTCSGARGQRYTVYYCNPLPECPPGQDCTSVGCESEYPEQSDKAPAYCNRPDTGVITDISRIFGQIQPPQAIQNFGFGGLGISKFLSNTIALIYIIAIIVLIFMILWSAFEWLTSGGDKEKVESARRRLTYAILGIILFAAAFAVIQIIGTFTGFNFFVGQKP